MGYLRQTHNQRQEELKTMMGWDDMGGNGWIVMTMSMLFFWSLVVLAVVAIFRRDGNLRPSDGQPSERTALQILDERFARGEIEADDYHARREILRAGH
ncbi:MAG: SHOCT domain-containing protein [Aeromicrobium sp.]